MTRFSRHLLEPLQTVHAFHPSSSWRLDSMTSMKKPRAIRNAPIASLLKCSKIKALLRPPFSRACCFFSFPIHPRLETTSDYQRTVHVTGSCHRCKKCRIICRTSFDFTNRNDVKIGRHIQRRYCKIVKCSRMLRLLKGKTYCWCTIHRLIVIN